MVVADGRVVCKIVFCEYAVHGSPEGRALLGGCLVRRMWLGGSSIAEGDVGGRRPRWMLHEPEGALLR